MDMQISKIEEELTNITYNVLCSDRVTQMTKTYNDIEAVTRLLEEGGGCVESQIYYTSSMIELIKKKQQNWESQDFENPSEDPDYFYWPILFCFFIESHTKKSRHFDIHPEKNEELEQLITQANERINQLKHDLSMKDELLKIYTQNYEGVDSSSPDSPDGKTVPGLQKKIQSLEDENLQLHLETFKAKGLGPTGWEKKGKQIWGNDVYNQFEDVHGQLSQLSRELVEKSEECCSQKEEITNLLHQIVTLQKKVRTLTADNMDLQKTLEAAYDSQNYLTREIADLKEKNEEILALLEETQEELRRFRSKERPSVMRHSFMSPMFNSTGESLASELENSMRSEVDYPKGYSSMERKKHTWKVFETAKAAKSPARHGSGSSCATSMLGASLADNDDSRSVSQRSSMYFSDTESAVSENCTGELESLYGATPSRYGKPGIPGSNDLHTALRRLSMRRANEINEMDYAKEERERQEREQKQRERRVILRIGDTQVRCRTPEQAECLPANQLSFGYMSMTGSSTNPHYKMPEKLQIIKPLEGRLEHCCNVAKSSELMSDLRNIDVCTSDVDTDSVTTVVEEEITSSFTSSSPRMALGRVAENHGTSTFSMSLGLASILNERDLKEESQPGIRHHNVSSNPARFPSLSSDQHFKAGHTSTPLTTLTLPTNSYKLIPSPVTLPQRSERSFDGSVSSWQGISSTLGSQRSNSVFSSPGQQGSVLSTNANGTENANSDSNRLKVINKLKTTGFSLYGYITGAVPVNASGEDNSRPSSLPLPTVTTAGATALNSVATVTESVTTLTTVTDNVDIDSMVTMATTTAESRRKSHLSSILARKTAGGVIGALTKWHKDGSL
ncbi:trafficking kinesin-binding protein 1-like [Ruditapes philippinarum]|uniref:trafficking kinesin-binding protein 1-like n=1 Tax=Ruditapes philippinarum TaxID=129788 RepID=UPI00295B278A|nr:trafficking kinesin-binding protein 1-like [Ruditapes philippinarum]